jgi:DNA-binding transcriptional ArsR family regulator
MTGDAPAETSHLKLETVLYALSDPVRLHIVQNLAEKGELACYAAVTGLDIAKSTQSHHYRILREAGLIVQRKEGVCFISTLCRKSIDERFPGLLDAVLRNFQSSRQSSIAACS